MTISGYQDEPFIDLVPYLGSKNSSVLRASIFETTPLYVPTDSTWISEIFARFYRKMYFDENGNTAPANNDVTTFLDNYFSTLKNRPLPTTIENLAKDFVDFAYSSLNVSTPSLAAYESRYLDDTGPNPLDLKESLELIIKANLGLWQSDIFELSAATSGLLNADQFDTQSYNGNVFPGAQINAGTTGINFSNLTPQGLGLNSNAPVNIQSMIDTGFANLMTSINWSTVTGVADAVAGFEKFYARFAAISTYFKVYSAFNVGALSTDQATKDYMFGFIQNLINTDPTSFNPSQDFGTWFTKVANDYLNSLNVPAPTTQSAMGPSFAKVSILNRIYALLTKMIGIIQKTTAAQADTLKILGFLQGEMTNMISKADILTSSDNTLELNDDTATNASTLRDELNSVITAWTDTIRAQRDFVKSTAQSQQTNVNNSNDAVNQQASMATAFIQQQSTLLSAIYR